MSSILQPMDVIRLTVLLLSLVVPTLAMGQPVSAQDTDVSELETKPNIVLILVDDFGQRDLACYGSTFYKTPNMDQLAAAGIRFTNAYSAYARCVPSRTGLLSGKFPCRIEYQSLKAKTKQHHLPLSEVTFGEALKDHGYRTCYIGKWHLGKEGGGPGDQGFDTVVHAGSAGATGSYFYPFDVEKGNFVEHPVDGKEGDYLNDRLTDKAVDYIQANRNQPFLMVMAHYAVHTPFEAPEALKKQFQRRLRLAGEAVGGKRNDADLVVDRQGMTKTVQNNPTYAAMVENTDHSVGRIVEAIKANGIEENTVVILTSDHGGLSTRGLSNSRPLATSNAPFRQGKGSIFEGGTRVPLIVKWPAKIKEADVSNVQVTGTDLYPTMLEIANAPLRPKQHVDGVSFVPALRGESYQRKPMYWYKWMARPDSTGDTRAIAMIDGRYKLISWIDEELTELFDLDVDPGEKNNLAKQQPERAKGMLSRIKEFENEVGQLREPGKKMLQKRLERNKKKKLQNSKSN